MTSRREVKEVTWSRPASDHIMKIFNGFRYTMAVLPACELKIFDKIAAHPDGISAARLAEQHSWHVDNTVRLLNAQVSLGFLQKKLGPDHIEIYQITDVGKLMVSNQKDSYHGMLSMFSKVYLKSVPGVVKQVTSGAEGEQSHWVLPQLDLGGGAGKQGHQCAPEQCQTAAPQPDGGKPPCCTQPGEGKKGKENELVMYQIMESLMYPYVSELVRAFDLSSYKSAVDIGGGTGFLSYELSRTYPDMKVTLFEIPSIIKIAKEHFQPPDFDKLHVQYVGGDCLKDDVPKADLYVFCKVLHHFTTEKMEQLFTRLNEKLPSGGAVLIFDDVFRPMKDGPGAVHCFDLMLMARQVGRNRTLEEFATVLERCNFMDIQCIHTNEECVYDIIFAVKH